MKSTSIGLAIVAAALGSAGSLTAQVHPIQLPCCTITGLNPTGWVAQARVTATGAIFAFRAPNAGAFSNMKVGQGVYANFAAKQVSLDGRSACCTIVVDPHAPSGATPASRAPAAPSRPAAPSIAVSGPAAMQLPVVEYGDRRAANLAHAEMVGRFETRTVTATRAGQSLSAATIKVHGLDGIEKVPGLNPDARRLLEIHVRRIPQGESDYYIINPQLAEQWMQSHPHVPDDIQPPDVDQNTHSGCHAFSWHCAQEAAAHAADQVQNLIDQAQDVWNHASHELAHDWNVTESCFADQTISLGQVPVQFQTSPSMTVPLYHASGKAGGGAASGTVDGSVTVGFPMQSDFNAGLDLFYIPCLPFVIRPRSLSAAGTIKVAEQFTAAVKATGQFKQTLTIPPTGGARIPLYVIPIMVGHVPVAELDVSAYIEGNVEVGGKGSAQGQFQVLDPHQAQFSFSCTGHGCSGDPGAIPLPTTATETAQINGQVYVKPAIFTALQLDFDVSMLSARAGPQPYLLGTASGCQSGTASQSTDGSSSSSENHILAGDLDWGMDLRAEALIGGKVVGNSYVHRVTGSRQGHLWFRDLAPGGSTALVADVTASAASAAHPASLQVRMPSCYPYTEAVQYQVSWTGNAAPGTSPACQWSAGKGSCKYDPAKPLPLSLTWAQPGNYVVSVATVRDDHDRRFSQPARDIQVSVSP